MESNYFFLPIYMFYRKFLSSNEKTATDIEVQVLKQ